MPKNKKGKNNGGLTASKLRAGPAKREVSVEGQEWLKLATDPYHDNSHEIAGFPDADNTYSVVRCHNLQVDVSAPGAGNWDCHVFTMPFMVTQGFYNANQGNHFARVNPQNNTQYGYSLVNVNTVAAGAAIWSSTTDPVTNLTIPQDEALMEGTSRIIGMAIEVINTTAPVNAQGMCTAYKFCGKTQKRNMFYDDDSKVQAVDCLCQITPEIYEAPASTVAEAVNFPGSLQWHAREGAYMPVPIDVPNNFYEPHAGHWGLIKQGDETACNISSSTLVQTNQLYPAANIKAHIEGVGLVFSGLGSSNTLTIKARVYVETVPSPISSSIPLTTPSAPFDPEAFIAYSRVVAHMPIATVSSNNASGEWFKAVIRTLRTVFDPAFTMLGMVFPKLGKGYVKGADFVERGIDQIGRLIPILP